jgi:hypothetical protein
MVQDCRWRRIYRQVQSTIDFRCYMIARNLISSSGWGRRHLDDLLEKKRLAGDLFVRSTLAGYASTLVRMLIWVWLATMRRPRSKDGRGLREVITGCSS